MATYKCEDCGGIFEDTPDWSEADALTEYQQNFTAEVRAADPELPMRVCEDCYQKFMAEFNRRRPHQAQSVPSAKSRPH